PSAREIAPPIPRAPPVTTLVRMGAVPDGVIMAVRSLAEFPGSLVGRRRGPRRGEPLDQQLVGVLCPGHPPVDAPRRAPPVRGADELPLVRAHAADDVLLLFGDDEHGVSGGSGRVAVDAHMQGAEEMAAA